VEGNGALDRRHDQASPHSQKRDRQSP
jgi:hypothetical protein